MARIPRRQLMSTSEPGVFHVFSRTVRRSFLMGEDLVTGKSYEQRREDVFTLINVLSRIFLVEVLAVSIMQNHIHEILRNRPDLAQRLSDHEVAVRWCLLNEQGMSLKASRDERTPRERRRLKKKIDEMVQDKERVRMAREALSNISVYEKRLKSTIARMANLEDQVSGHFFSGRFESIPITDALQLLITMVYVDLNPIRAGLAETPESSRYTSAYERIHGMHARMQLAQKQAEFPADVAIELQLTEEQLTSIRELGEQPEVRAVLDAWLCPIDERREQTAPDELDNLETVVEQTTLKSESTSTCTVLDRQAMVTDEAQLPVSTMNDEAVRSPSRSVQREKCIQQLMSQVNDCHDSADDPPYLWQLPARASNKGCLPMTIREYLRILDWTGRQIRTDKSGHIPDELPPILERLKVLDTDTWLASLNDYATRLRGFFTFPVNQLVEATKCIVNTVNGTRSAPDAMF